MMEIKVKYHDIDLYPLEQKDGQDWIDLRSAEDVEMKAGEYRLICLGVAMELPVGFEAHIVPRSSTFKNFGILQTNGQGVIDESYRGEKDVWLFPAYAVRDTKINKNDRICQFRIIRKQPTLKFIPVSKLENPNRNGLGSSGIR
jgi:dUTP pyrophosphatase